MVCHETDVADANSCFTTEIGRESVNVVRTKEGALRAFYNVCLHRGNRIRHAKGPGGAVHFRCPYHLWTWDLDGELVEVPDADTFPQGIDCEALRLRSLKCDTWNGFVFVNLDPDAEPLLDYLGILDEHESWCVTQRVRSCPVP